MTDITKFKKSKIQTLEDWIDNLTLTEEAATYLVNALRDNTPIVISGGCGSGKTTLINSLLLSKELQNKRTVIFERVSEVHLLDIPTTHITTDYEEVIDTSLIKDNLNELSYVVLDEFSKASDIDKILEIRENGTTGSIISNYSSSIKDSYYRLASLYVRDYGEVDTLKFNKWVSGIGRVFVQLAHLSDGRRIVSDIAKLELTENNTLEFKSVFKADIKINDSADDFKLEVKLNKVDEIIQLSKTKQ